jgi:hypothetical protein
MNEDYEWIFGNGVKATVIRPGEVYLLEADGGKYAVISWFDARMLINGSDIELDESVWGLGDELAEGPDGTVGSREQGLGESWMLQDEPGESDPPGRYGTR